MKLIIMNYFSVVFCSILFSVTSSFSQEKIEKYIVGKGETVIQIAQKFRVTPYEIYKLNPDAQKGLKPNSVLLIPINDGKSNVAPPKTVTQQPKAVTQEPKTHLVIAKETLFAIENKYNVTDEDLKKANPDLVKYGLQIGMVLNIPSKTAPKTPVTTKNITVYHTVLPKETKYSIAKKYDITIEELERKNPGIVANLTVGYELLIKGNATKPAVQTAPAETKIGNEKHTAVTTISEPIHYVDYTVKPKETFYSLSKMFGLTQQQLIELNPNLSAGVQEGMVLKLPSKS